MNNRFNIALFSNLFMFGFSVFFFILVFTACDSDRFYDESRPVDEKGWQKDSAATFNFEVKDTTRLYNFYITLRNNDEYPFRNFYFFLNTHLPNNNFTRDTIELLLADKDGKWVGRGFGSLKDNQIVLRQNLRFPLAGNYTFQIQQAMRKEYLEGITDVGIRVEYAK